MLCDKCREAVCSHEVMKGIEIVFAKMFRDVHDFPRLLFLFEITANKPFYNDHVAPDTIEFAMLFIHSNFTKAERTYELPEGILFVFCIVSMNFWKPMEFAIALTRRNPSP